MEDVTPMQSETMEIAGSINQSNTEWTMNDSKQGSKIDKKMKTQWNEQFNSVYPATSDRRNTELKKSPAKKPLIERPERAMSKSVKIIKQKTKTEEKTIIYDKEATPMISVVTKPIKDRKPPQKKKTFKKPKTPV